MTLLFALAESRISEKASRLYGHLLHREEGIDLRLPRAARTTVLVEVVAYPGQRRKPQRCWVSLDENLVLNVNARIFDARIDLDKNSSTQHRSHLRMGVDDESNQVT